MSFKSVQKGIARKGGYSMKSAGAILASASRNASPAAKRRNPNLNKVMGSSRGMAGHMVRNAHGIGA